MSDADAAALFRFAEAHAYFGTPSCEAVLVSPPGSAAALSWFLRGRPLELLVVGFNGPAPGWTAGATATGNKEPICGMTTANVLCEPFGSVFVVDVEHGSLISVGTVKYAFDHYAASGVDDRGRPMPDDLGKLDEWTVGNCRASNLAHTEASLSDLAGTSRPPFDPSVEHGLCLWN